MSTANCILSTRSVYVFRLPSRYMPNVSPYIIHRLVFIMDTVYLLREVWTVLLNVDIFVSQKFSFTLDWCSRGWILGKCFANVKRLKTAGYKQRQCLRILLINILIKLILYLTKRNNVLWVWQDRSSWVRDSCDFDIKLSFLITIFSDTK